MRSADLGFRCMLVATVVLGCSASLHALLAGEGESAGVPLATTEEPAPAPGVETSAEAFEAALQGETHDGAFTRFFDVEELRRAIQTLNAAGVADAALQLAEGERVLLRSHKAITADELLGLAAHMASLAGDKATLHRLSEFAKREARKGLAEQLALAEKLGTASRSSDSAALESENATPQQVSLFKTFRDRITLAAIAGNPASLAEIEKALTPESGFTGGQLGSLRQDVARARESASTEKTSALVRQIAASGMPGPDVLEKLSSPSRNFILVPIQGVWKSGPLTVVFSPGDMRRAPNAIFGNLITANGVANRYEWQLQAQGPGWAQGTLFLHLGNAGIQGPLVVRVYVQGGQQKMDLQFGVEIATFIKIG